MQPLLFRNPGFFLERKISISQAIKILKRNGIETNEAQAKELLEFLFVLARIYKGRSPENVLSR